MSVPRPPLPLSALGYRSGPGHDPEAYRSLARRLAASVTVVTTLRPDPTGPWVPDGFTATAFLTVSMAPPIVLVSATNASSAMAMLRGARHFVVNLLSSAQQPLAEAFAAHEETRDRVFEAVSWAPDAAGVPVLAGGLGAFSARVRQQVDAGDHTLVLGDVTAVHLGPDDPPGSAVLLYHNRAYGTVGEP